MTKEAAFLLCYFKLISWAFFHLSPGSLELFPIGIIPLLTNNLIQDMNRISNQILRINLSLGLIRTSDSAKFLTLHVRVFKTFFFFFKTCLKLQSSQITFFFPKDAIGHLLTVYSILKCLLNNDRLYISILIHWFHISKTEV